MHNQLDAYLPPLVEDVHSLRGGGLNSSEVTESHEISAIDIGYMSAGLHLPRPQDTSWM